MKICYFGAVCNPTTFNIIVRSCKKKPHAAGQQFERMLVEGLASHENIKVEVNTFPPVPALSMGYSLGWGRKVEPLNEHVLCKWLPALNFQGIKQFCFFVSAFAAVISWVYRTLSQSRAIVLYTAYFPVALAVVIAARIYRIPIVLVETDLAEFIQKYSPRSRFKSLFVPLYVRLTRLIREQFDAYIFVAEEMNKAVNVMHKPYIVVEGMVDTSTHRPSFVGAQGHGPRIVMYAGALFRIYGVDKLIQSFMTLHDDNISLWLFGSGDMEVAITDYCVRDKRISYFGHKTHEEVLSSEAEATLLVNPRPSSEEFTKYSFPSKNMEYMASGTPVLTTPLPGMPREYYDYVYLFEDESVAGMAKTLEHILSQPKEELHAKGAAAKEFVLREKNNIVQAKKIINLIMDSTT